MAEIDPPGAPDASRVELARLLVLHLGAGTLESKDVVPAVQALLGGAAGSRRELLEALARQDLPAVRPLVRRLVELRAMDALRYHELRSAGEPIPPELAGELIHLDIKTSGESSELDTASTAIEGPECEARAGNSCTWRSTTPPDWLTSRSSPMNRPPRPLRFVGLGLCATSEPDLIDRAPMARPSASSRPC